MTTPVLFVNFDTGAEKLIFLDQQLFSRIRKLSVNWNGKRITLINSEPDAPMYFVRVLTYKKPTMMAIDDFDQARRMIGKKMVKDYIIRHITDTDRKIVRNTPFHSSLSRFG